MVLSSNYTPFFPTRARPTGRTARLCFALQPLTNPLDPSVLNFQLLRYSGYATTLTFKAVAGQYLVRFTQGVNYDVPLTVPASVSSITEVAERFGNSLSRLNIPFRAGEIGTGTCEVTSGADFTVAVITEPNVGDVTAGAVAGAGTELAAGSTQMTIATALSYPVEQGQFLNFIDDSKQEFLVELTSTAAAGATSIAIAATDRAIPAGAVALWPPVLQDRTSNTVDRSATTSTTDTYETSGEITFQTGTTASFSADGLDNEGCPVQRTVSKNFDAGRNYYYFNLSPVDLDVFAEGRRVVGIAVPESFNLDLGLEATTRTLDGALNGLQEIPARRYA